MVAMFKRLCYARCMRKKPGRKLDLNELAASIVAEAVDEEKPSEALEENPPGKDPLAVELGRRGGKKGGKARAAKLTPDERSEIARKAAKARWSSKDK